MIHKSAAKIRKPGQPVNRPASRKPAQAGAFNTKSYHKGEVIFKEGHIAHVAYLIKKGVVQIYKVIDNQRKVLADLTPGQIFGEMGVIMGEPRMASAMALEFCELVSIDENTINMCLKQSPPVINSLTKLLIQRIRTQAQQLYEKKEAGVDVFMTVCTLLEIFAQGSTASINYDKVSAKIKEIVPVSQLDIDGVVQQLFKINLVGIEKSKTKINAVKLNDPPNFVSTARGFYENWNPNQDVSESEYLDLQGFAEKVKTMPDIIYKKIAAQEIPENLFFFHNKGTDDWIAEMGEAFFQKAKKIRKKVEDFSSVDDIVFLDKDTLGSAVTELGINGMGALLSKTGDEAKKKIMANMGKKMRDVIEEEFPPDREIDEIEADEFEEEFIKIIKRLKGVLKEEEEGGGGDAGGEG